MSRKNMKRRSQKRREESFYNGCLGILLPFCIVFAPIYFLFCIVTEYIVVLLIIIAVVIILAKISFKVEEKNVKKAERQKNIDIINAIETKPSLIPVPYLSSFNNAEEDNVNRQFREYIKQKNKIIEATSHLEYLANKSEAFTALGQEEDASNLKLDIQDAQNILAEVKAKPIAFNSKEISLLYKNVELKQAYSAFVDMLDDDKIELLNDFFKDPMVKAITINESTVLLFTPGYILEYSTSLMVFHIHTYDAINISTKITTEVLKGSLQFDDEVEHIGYLYETKDGKRDMRYSYKNNPTYIFVYRGSVTIHCNDISYEKKFSNKSLAKTFEKDLKAYINLLRGIYKDIEQAVSNGSLLLKFGNIKEELIEQLYTEIKL